MADNLLSASPYLEWSEYERRFVGNTLQYSEKLKNFYTLFFLEDHDPNLLSKFAKQSFVNNFAQM